MAPTNKQQVVIVDEFEPERYLQHVKVVERDVPVPAAGEVLVRMRLRPINPSEVIAIKTGYGGRLAKGVTPGGEGMGVVAQLGLGVTGVEEGQRVVPLGTLYTRGAGTYAQYLVVPQDELVPVPDELSDEQAAQLYVNPPTAYGLLKSTGASKGDWVLQTAATSIVGRQVIALAKHWGIRTINVIRREGAAQELKQLGADEVLVIGKDNIVERVMQITGGKGAHSAADAVGGKGADDILKSLRAGGVSYVYGVLADEGTLQVDQGAMVMKPTGVQGFYFPAFVAQHDARALFKELADLMVQGVLPVGRVDKTHPLERIVDALKEVEQAKGGVKIMLDG